MALSVCVVGAGISGLIALKELLEGGHRVRCYESYRAEGGIFKPPPEGLSYESLKLTVSNYFMAYSCFPPPEGEERRYWTGDEYRDYLARFVERFGLRKHIEFDTEVRKITRLPDNRFRATLARDGRALDETFDAVAVCVGSQRAPYRPRLEGEDVFRGTIAHSSSYMNPSGFTGKRVVCIGMGESSADIVKEISEVSSSCVLSFRRYPSIVQRYPYGRAHTADAYSDRITHSLPRTWMSRRGLKIARKVIDGSLRVNPAGRVMYDWRIRGQGSANQFLTKNDEFIASIVDGKILVKPHAIERLEAHEVVFSDGSRVAADVVMCCTGYSPVIDIVEGVRISDIRSLYKHMFHPGLGARIAFVGWARPAQGGVPACAEMQSRYFSLVLGGKRRLPPAPELEELIRSDREKEEGMFHVQPHMTTLVHYTDYMDALAELIGCQIRKRALMWRPRLLFHVVCGSNIAATYRLRGPGSQFDAARRLIVSLPVAWRMSELATFATLRIALQMLKLVGARIPR